MFKTVFMIVFLIASYLLAGDLVEGLESTNSFFTGTLLPVLATLGLIFSALMFYFGQGPEATKRSLYVFGGSILAYTGSWIQEQLRMFFGG